MASRSTSGWIGKGMVAAALAVVVGLMAPATGRAADFFGLKPKPGAKGEAAKPTDGPWNETVAEVNGEKITMEQLAQELIDAHGKKQLELMVNRKLVEQACKEKKVAVANAELDAELKATITKLNINRKEFIEQVLARQELSLRQYMRDTVWPALALKKLVADKVVVTPEDVEKSFEANYGEKVEIRMLVVREVHRANELWKKVMEAKADGADKTIEEKVAEFEGFCKLYSVDEATRPYGGRTQPISRHSNHPEIEKLAYS
ncbi:MAG: hypothetical protein ACRC1K_25585, partial [Planctomycetia bacterium]